MKKILSVIALVLVLALSVACFASCGFIGGLLGNDQGNQGDQGDQGNQDETNDDANKVTVCWYQGSKLLKEEKVEKGSKLESWTPEAEGKTFTGWYAEASLAQPFDFDKAVESDVDIFAAFKSDEYIEDDKAYYLCGTGSGDMGKSGWNQADQDSLAMTKEDVEGANVYTITIKMYAGDRFQILYGGTWDGQVGIGYMAGAEYCDGVNDYDKVEYTAADKKVAQVKNEAGEVVFTGSDEYNKGFEVWNIILAPGMDGIYKITYTTYPASPAYNQITYELVEKIEALEKTHDMYFIGTMNNWNTSYEDNTLALSESEDKSTWTGILTITEADYADWALDENGEMCAAFKIYNTVDGLYHGIGGENILLKAGTYAVKYTVEGNVVEFAKCDYYVVGTFLDADGNSVNYAVKDGVTPALEVADGVATGSFTAIDVTENSAYTWIASQGKPGVFAIKVVYGSELGIATWYSDDANGGDNWYVAAGEYNVSLDIATGVVTITPAN